MKPSKGFDPCFISAQRQGKWRWRMCATCSALLTALGMLLLMAGIAGAMHRLNGELASIGGNPLSFLLGLLLLWFGVVCWRICRRSRRRKGFGMASGLLK